MKKKILNKAHILKLAIKYGYIKKGRVDSIGYFDSPGPNPTGLCYDGYYI